MWIVALGPEPGEKEKLDAVDALYEEDPTILEGNTPVYFFQDNEGVVLMSNVPLTQAIIDQYFEEGDDGGLYGEF